MTNSGQPQQSEDESAGNPLTGVVRRNIRTLVEARRKERGRRSPSEQIADAITTFTGSVWSAVAHAVVFGSWIAINSGWIPAVRPFDPFPFVMLAMIASVEAIYLTTFVLISQNRMGRLADERADLDVQISLLAENEITQVLRLVDAIARRLDIPLGDDETLKELKSEVKAEAVLEEIQRARAGVEQK